VRPRKSTANRWSKPPRAPQKALRCGDQGTKPNSGLELMLEIRPGRQDDLALIPVEDRKRPP